MTISHGGGRHHLRNGGRHHKGRHATHHHTPHAPHAAKPHGHIKRTARAITTSYLSGKH